MHTKHFLLLIVKGLYSEEYYEKKEVFTEYGDSCHGAFCRILRKENGRQHREEQGIRIGGVFLQCQPFHADRGQSGN